MSGVFALSIVLQHGELPKRDAGHYSKYTLFVLIIVFDISPPVSTSLLPTLSLLSLDWDTPIQHNSPVLNSSHEPPSSHTKSSLTSPPAKPPLLNPYIYDPSTPAAITGTTILLLLSMVIVYQYILTRSYFLWTFMLGLLMEITGYTCRLISAYNEHNTTPFLFAFLMILLAPTFLAAACYTAFSRVVWFSCPPDRLNARTLWCWPRWITVTFVCWDLVASAVQVVGASTLSEHYARDHAPQRSMEESERDVVAGRVVLVIGLLMQVSCYLSFAIIALRYFIISLSFRNEDLGDWKMWRKLSYMINIAAGLITLRAIYRTLEMPHDKDSGLLYLQRHEWCFWVFDALPIAAVLGVMVVWFPGRYLPRSYTGLRLDKRRAVQEKVDLKQMGGEGGAEAVLREFNPQDFGGAVDSRV
jgi:hypothetical protein